MNPPLRTPTPEEIARTHARVQAACGQADKVIQALDELIKWFERENQLPAMHTARIVRPSSDS